MNAPAQQRLQTLKRIAKPLRIASLVFAIVGALAVVLFLLMPAANLQTDIGKYADGYNYYGWQLTFLGCGYIPVAIFALFEPAGALAGAYVPNTYDFGFNIWTTLAVILPVVAAIVCGIVKLKMKNRGKAVCEFVMAACFLFGGIMLLNVVPLSTLVASDLGAGTGFRMQILQSALDAGTYRLLAYPVVLFVICLLAAIVKAGNGAFLLYQRSYARKNRPNNISMEEKNGNK